MDRIPVVFTTGCCVQGKSWLQFYKTMLVSGVRKVNYGKLLELTRLDHTVWGWCIYSWIAYKPTSLGDNQKCKTKKKQKIIPPPQKIGVPPPKKWFHTPRDRIPQPTNEKIAARRHGTNQRHQPRALRLAPRGPVRHRGLRGAKRGHLAAGPRGVAGAEVLVVQALGNGYGSIMINTY